MTVSHEIFFSDYLDPSEDALFLQMNHLAKKHHKLLVFVFVGTVCFIFLTRPNPVWAKEVTKEFFEPGSETFFRVYDYRPIRELPKKMIPKEVISSKTTDITLNIDLGSLFRPSQKIIDTHLLNETEFSKKHLINGLVCGAGFATSNLVIRGGIIPGAGWLANKLGQAAFGKMKRMFSKKAEKEKEKDVDELDLVGKIWSILHPNKKPVEEGLLNGAGMISPFLNPSVYGPLSFLLIIYMIKNRVDTDKANRYKMPWEKKEVPIVDVLMTPMKTFQKKPETPLEKLYTALETFFYWVIYHPHYILILYALYYYRLQLKKFFLESDYRQTIAQGFVSNLQDNSKFLQKMILSQDDKIDNSNSALVDSYKIQSEKAATQLKMMESKLMDLQNLNQDLTILNHEKALENQQCALTLIQYNKYIEESKMSANSLTTATNPWEAKDKQHITSYNQLLGLPPHVYELQKKLSEQLSEPFSEKPLGGGSLTRKKP